MKSTFKTDSVFFVQSLKESDEETGRYVQDELVLNGLVPSERAIFFRVFDAKDLKGSLAWILNSIFEKKISYPCIQIDCHGSEEGLHLRSDELVVWHRVQDFLNQILVHTDNNLLVILGACHGSFLFESNVLKYLPCSVLVASRQHVEGKSLGDRFFRFYSTLFETGRISTALSELNREVASNAGLFEVHLP